MKLLLLFVRRSVCARIVIDIIIFAIGRKETNDIQRRLKGERKTSRIGLGHEIIIARGPFVRLYILEVMCGPRMIYASPGHD